MQVLELNIGQNVGTAHIHTLDSDLAAVAIVFPELSVTRAYTRIALSGEHTSCVRLCGNFDLTGKLPARIDYLCSLTAQEAIPCILDGDGVMYGPKAAEWGAFNPDLWLAPVSDNRPVQCDDALWTLRHDAVLERNGWSVGTHNETLSGWFERNSDGTGGGLWYERNADDRLELIDYDGTYSLPTAVLCLLRDIGVQCDSSFE